MEKSAEKKPCVIEIIEANGLLVTKYKRPPNAFVEVKVEGVSYKTKTVKSNTSPSWKKSFLIPDVSSMLSLRVFHDGGLFTRNDFLGGIECQVSDFLKASAINDRDIIVRLEALEDKRNIPDRGSLTLRLEHNLWVEACRAVPQAVETSSKTSAPKILTVFDTLPDTSVVISVAQNVPAPVQTLIKSLDPIMDILGELAKVHPFASLAWAVVSSLYKISRGQVVQDQCVVDLCQTMADTYLTAKKASVLNRITDLKNIIDKMIFQTVHCAMFVQEYFDRGFASRLIQDMISTKSVKIREFNTVFSKLKISFEEELMLQITCVAFRSADKIDELLRDTKLVKLKPVDMFTMNRPRCLPLTRLELLNSIARWAMDPSPEEPQNVFLLWGFSGTGKSTLAMTVADMFSEVGRLGAFLFFDRNSAEGRDPRMVIRTLAYNLAVFDDQIGKEVASAVDRNPHIIQRSHSDQFRILIEEPLRSIDSLCLPGPILVILDALDECGDETEKRNDLLSVLASGFAQLPLSFRILVTSRPEPDIRQAFDELTCIRSHELDTRSESNIQDILLFIEDRIGKIEKKRHWRPGSDKISELGTRVAGLFIWASTACEFIDGAEGIVNHDKRLELVLSNRKEVKGQTSVNALYITVLNNLLDWKDEDLVKVYDLTIGTILAAKTPLSAKAITALHQTDDLPLSMDVIQVVRPLSSLLSGTHDNTARLRPLHKSFNDFLTDPKHRLEPFFIDREQHSQRLARLCLNRMKSLKRISSSDEPCKLNREVNLKTHLVQHAPDDLHYACRFWSEHLIETADDSLYDPVSTFFFNHLLHWIELLSLMGALDGALLALARVNIWLKHNGRGDERLTRLVQDGDRFLREFFDPILKSAGTVYSSALPFTPTDTVLFKTYEGERDILVMSGNRVNWSSCLGTLEGHIGRVRLVVFSPDGKILASASGDSKVRLWDAETGKAIGSALEGHTDEIRSVVFSPDGKKLASTSGDNTVRLWNVETGQTIASALESHTDSVWSVVFSPDGKKLVSASRDGTVRLCDVVTGQAIASPLEGDTDNIRSVVFSPDGKKVASPSSDYAVRLWDVETRQAIGCYYIGSVDSVVFSQDGKKLASVSHNTVDSTVRLWDVVTGPSIAFTLEGHTSRVSSVIFSPDGKKLASASWDSTVRLWDVETGQVIGPALEGHAHQVNSVVFSPDGKKLATAGITVRLWDVETRQAIGSALEGHTHWVNSIVFSPDGKKLASASDDGTVRLWDAKTEQDIASALEGHTARVSSVAFSPDGKRLASASNDGTVRLWDAVTGKPIGPTLRGHTGMGCPDILFSSDGKKLASVYDKKVQLWDVVTEQPIALKGYTWLVSSVVFSPDGKKLASASLFGTVQLWDVETGQTITSTLEGHTRKVNSVVFSPDGKKLASASNDGTVRLWDAETGQAIGSALEGHTHKVNLVVFSPDGKMLASASDDYMVYLWDVVTGPSIAFTLEGHTSRVSSVVFSPDGKKLASASWDNTVRLWDVETGQAIGPAVEGHTCPINWIVFSPDGKMLASASDDCTVRLWDVETGPPITTALERHPCEVSLVVISPGGKRLASASWDNTVRLWDVETRQAIGSALEDPDDLVTSVIFSPDGKKLASAGSTARLWDVETGQAIGSALEAHTHWVNSVVFSPDGRKLASVSLDNTVQLWDVETRQAIAIASPLEGHTDHIVREWSFMMGETCPLPSLPQSLATSSHVISTDFPPHAEKFSIVDGFLQYAGKRLFWLSHELRGVCAAYFPVVAIGGSNGAVTLVRWQISN